MAYHHDLIPIEIMKLVMMRDIVTTIFAMSADAPYTREHTHHQKARGARRSPGEMALGAPLICRGKGAAAAADAFGIEKERTEPS